jgi:hypothetical protein
MKTRKLNLKDVKNYLAQREGCHNWADTWMPYNFGKPGAIKRKILYFLVHSDLGKELQEHLKSKEYFEYSTKDFNENNDFYYMIDSFYEPFCEKIKGLTMDKYF